MKRNKMNWRIPKGAELTELDKKVLYYQDRGHLVPTRELIKTPKQIEGIRKSGVINTAVLDLVEKSASNWASIGASNAAEISMSSESPAWSESSGGTLRLT